VHAIDREVPPSEPRDDVASYLRSVHLRFANSIHAQTRVYTARAVAKAYELHWNSYEVPGETLLGTFGWSVPPELISSVESLLAKGETVRLFIFNSDADLCFQEGLQPCVP
jgi:hypothetical protein